MHLSPRSVCLRAATLGLLLTAALGGLITVLVPTIDLAPDQDFAGLLTQCCTVVLLGCLLWGWVQTVLLLVETSLAAVRHRGLSTISTRRRGVPVAYRRLVLSACGLALSAGGVAPALATPGPVHIAPLPAAAAPAAHSPMPARRGDHAEEIVVQPGDSLWRLAAERLPAEADNATIAHTWHRLYAANRAVIGADPDLLEPGERLVRPRVW